MKSSRRGTVVMAKKLSEADLDSVQGGATAATMMVRAGFKPRQLDEMMLGMRSSLTGDLTDPLAALRQLTNPAAQPTVRQPTVTNPTTPNTAAQTIANAADALRGNTPSTPAATTPRVRPSTPSTPSTTLPTTNIPMPTPRPANLGGITPTGPMSEVAASAALHNAGLIRDDRFEAPTTRTGGSDLSVSAALHNQGLIQDERFMTQAQINQQRLAGYEDLASPPTGLAAGRGSEVAASAALHNQGLIQDERFMTQEQIAQEAALTPRYGSNEDADLAWAQRKATTQQTQAALDAYSTTGRPLYASDQDADLAYQNRVEQNLAGTASPYSAAPQYASDQDADYAWAQQQATQQQTAAATSAYASTGQPLYASDQDADLAYQSRVDQNLAGSTYSQPTDSYTPYSPAQSSPEVYGPPAPPEQYGPPAPAVTPSGPTAYASADPPAEPQEPVVADYTPPADDGSGSAFV